MGFNSIPELRGMPRREQARVWRKACLRLYSELRTWLLMAVFALFGIVGTALGDRIIGTIVTATGLSAWAAFLTEWARPYIRAELHKGN